MTARRILVVDDERSLCDYLAILLRREGFQVDVCTSVEEAFGILPKVRFDLVLADLMIGQRSGLEIVQAVQGGGPPILLMTAYGTVEKAVEALRAGAEDFILKPFQNEALLRSLRTALETPRSATRMIPKAAVVTSGDVLETMLVGSSSQIQALRQIVRRVAGSESTVLITGESGTGKEVVARALHRLSVRSARPFLPIHCAALSEGLLESELFGHVKGSYTGAVSDSVGLFVAAKGGTVFLDEIGEIPLSTQVKLLRVLQEREVTPVGGIQATPIDVRIVAATNVDLEGMVRKGLLREDLYYRLNVIRIETPSLRDRLEDLPILSESLLERIARRLARTAPRLSIPVLDRLKQHSWPGNIRELENVLERALVLREQGDLQGEDILVGRPSSRLSAEEPLQPTLEEVQKAYLYWILVRNQWRLPQAAITLGMDPTRLQRLIDQYGLFQNHDGPELM